MKKVFFLLFASTLLFSFGTKADKLHFSEFEIKNENGATIISVSENGEITAGGKELGKINKNGNLYDKAGNLLAKITADNMLENKDGKKLVRIDENGRIDNGSGLFMEWSEGGDFMRGTEKFGMTITPADKKSFQAASTIMFLYFFGSTVETTPPAGVE